MIRIRMIAQRLEGRMHTTVVAPISGDQYIKSLERVGVEVIAIDMYPLTRDFGGLVRYLLSFVGQIRHLRRLIKRLAPDIIHLNGAYQFKGLIAAIGMPQPVIWHMNDMYQPLSIQGLFKLLSRYADHFIFASKRTEDYYTSIAPLINNKRNVVIPAPVDIDKYYRKPISGRARSKPIDIVTIGYINRHKGIEYLLEAAKELENRPIRIHIVGPILDSQAVYGQRLRKESQALSNIIWHGKKNDTAKFLEDMDLYVCPSIREASPMSVWEAMSMALPIVSTDVGDVKTIIEAHRCGLVVPTRDGKALAKAIATMIDLGPSAMKEYGLRSRHAASEVMSLQVVSSQYIRFIEDIVCE